MKNVLYLFIVLLLPISSALAQQPFTEGTIKYKVVFETVEKKTFTGTYIFTFKNGQIRKDFMLSNGFDDVVLINTNNNTIYSLRAKNGKKYAIQLSMDEVAGRQQKFKGFTLKQQKNSDKEIAGMTAQKGELIYKDGSRSTLYYSPDWYCDQAIAYERFPDAHFLPLEYSYRDEVKGFTMHMVAEVVSRSPVESSVFRIPADYKMISNEEYKQISQR